MQVATSVLFRQIFFRILIKFSLTAWCTEVVGLTFVL
jgi:hypothetical protein